jgi:hypothetical protein
MAERRGFKQFTLQDRALQPGPKRHASMRTNWSQAPIEASCCKKPTKRNQQHDLKKGRGRKGSLRRNELRARRLSSL